MQDAAELGDHVNAVLHEGCSSNNGTINLLRGLAAKAKAMGQRQLYQCHTTGGLNADIIAAFLIGAGDDHYIASGGWYDGAVKGHWSPLLDRPLGDPLGDAAYDAVSTNWTRSFASGTKVTFSASKGAGDVEWASRGASSK
jgi:hypothetical protein